ncbi:hypothetical protein MKJ04_22300, partial [Pontibacter sp. E15-1]|uniref:hypothetical protein n=1 Tax=Pontibacter sp. E15-1 TaxID=2919918 RepID=UPI001F4FC810
TFFIFPLFRLLLLNLTCGLILPRYYTNDIIYIGDSGEIKLRKIKISYVDVNITTPFRINCRNFDESFGNQIQKVTVVDQKDLNKISRKIDKLKLSQNTAHPDVRIKLYLHYTNATTDTICLDGGQIVELNNVPTVDNVTLTETILGLY